MNAPLKRLDYLKGGLLGADDYQNAQTFLADVQALRCRSLHTWGIANGLAVTQRDGPLPAVTVAPGMAVDSLGRQIVLTQPQDVDLSREAIPRLYLTIAYATRDENWRICPQGAGYARRINEPILKLLSQAPPADGAVVLLAVLSFTPEWRLNAPDGSVRRYCGLQVGAVSFPRPGIASTAQPSIGIDSAGGPLRIASPLTDIFGSLRVDGRVSVGLSANAATTALAVQGAPGTSGKGLISSAGPLVYGSMPDTLAGVMAGDDLLVGDNAATARSFRVLSAADAQTVILAQAPKTPFQNEPFTSQPGYFLRVQTGEQTLALAVDSHGSVGIGGAPQTNVTLSVSGGDVRLDRGFVTQFSADGAVLAGDPTHALNFLASQNLLEVREAGDIVFLIGEPDPDALPAMILTRGGNMGIGVANPSSRLTVDGPISASKGLMFPDGSVQTDGVVAIPIGTVVDWWRPDATVSWSGDGFQLCDGATITDPASPLVGQKTPDLRQMFVCGVVSFEQIGATGGAATHTHTYAMNQHTHRMVHVHPVVGQTQSPEQTAGDRIAGSSISNENHTHSIETASGLPTPATTALNAPSDPVTTASASNLPPFITLLKVMRIK